MLSLKCTTTVERQALRMNMNGTPTASERVIFVTNEAKSDRFLPQVAKAGAEPRAFEPEDMPRVVDWEGVIEAPPDSKLLFDVEGGLGQVSFPSYHCCLRGCFLFYFDLNDVDDSSGPYVTYHNAPLGVIPLENLRIDYPPGGRRVFREHAHTDAKNGYELVMLHEPGEGGGPQRPPSFLVADSLGKRDKWAQALRARTEANRHTLLRIGYSSSTTRKAPTVAVASSSIRNEKKEEIVEKTKASRKASIATGRTTGKSIQQQVMEVSDDAGLANAVVEFGVAQFDEKDWINTYFQMNNADDAAEKCDQMEKWLTEMKRDLKGAVLEQYEYFVQASGEMTTMGLEVTSLKVLIERQLETLREMKNIKFLGSLRGESSGKDEIMGRSDTDNDDNNIDAAKATKRGHADTESFFSDMSSIEGGSLRRSRSIDDQLEDEDYTPIEIPDWLTDDIVEEISAIVRECRYSDAIELYVKTKSELSEILEKHERPTSDRLTSKQKDTVKMTLRELNGLGDRIRRRIEEALRRKNEALRQTFKRERADVNSMAAAPPMSPCSLNDDWLYLQLLVRIGCNKEAAEAYAGRRSLLLLETLNERPISGAGTVDLVIYAAQLSQSFFSCLASSVEGFLDLFLSSTPTTMNADETEAESVDASSLHSHSHKSLPAGAVASVVLWCDSELAKFATAFGGARILANLTLTPPSRDLPRKPRVVGGGPGDDVEKDRKNALEVAAQCIDQAFLYASRNLDSVGLPLTPRLAECIRMRLKGCEAEISALLDDRWQHLTSEWRHVGEDQEINGHMLE